MTIAPFLVRDASQSDAASVVAWFASREEAILWAGNALPAQVDACWLAGEIAAPEQTYRVFCEPDEGMIVAIYGLRFFAAERRAHLRRVAVNPQRRGLGIGRRLMTDALSVARDGEAEIMSLNVYGSNTAAIRLYEAMGFRTRLTTPAPEDPSYLNLFMSVELDETNGAGIS